MNNYHKEWQKLCEDTFSGVNECQMEATYIIENLEKENAELRDLVFKSWISQTERYNPDISQDIKTQWESSYMYKLLKEQGE
jgi:hypothetical protein